MDAPNPWKEKKQRSKGLAVARQIWTKLTVEQKCDSRLPDVVARMDEDERLGWAIEAGVPQLSDASWALCVAEIQIRVEDERRWRGQLDDVRATA